MSVRRYKYSFFRKRKSLFLYFLQLSVHDGQLKKEDICKGYMESRLDWTDFESSRYSSVVVIVV